MKLELKNISIRYAQQQVVENVSLDIAEGEITCLLGPSGSGKTSLLRAIAGFEKVAAGEIWIDSQCVSSSAIQRAPEQRGIGMVFQDLALLPHLTVLNNIALGLRHLDRAERSARVEAMLAVVGLQQAQDKMPHELSGGMQQRVALARALAPKPKLLLLDEPFSSLDPELRANLVLEVNQILRHENITALMVTHSQSEAFAMADRIALIQHGQLQQYDHPYALYHQPVQKHVAEFIGESVFIAGQITAAGLLSTDLGQWPVHSNLPAGTSVDVLVRADDVVFDSSASQQARILMRQFRGSHFLYELEHHTAGKLIALVASHHNHSVGELIGIQLDLAHAVVFARHA
jgi:iron(III) transport system ATP-binding protein